MTNETLLRLICVAYGVEDDRIEGAPSWLYSQHYDIQAKVGGSALDGDHTASRDPGELGRERMLQGLLSDRFKLAVHRDTKMIPVCELVAAGNGPKLRESTLGYADSEPRLIQVEAGQITGREVPVATLARMLSDQLGRPVVGQTRLQGHYDVTLQWPTSKDSADSAILTAVQEQLGLKLQPQLMQKEVLVIDHAETPSAE